MRAYGIKRHDALTCKYGCCTTDYHKGHDWGKRASRWRRKTARQAAAREIREEI